MSDNATNVDAPSRPRNLWELISQGLVQREKRPSRHRQYTHSRKSKQTKKKAKQIAQASRRRNRPIKHRTGIKAKRIR